MLSSVKDYMSTVDQGLEVIGKHTILILGRIAEIWCPFIRDSVRVGLVRAQVDVRISLGSGSCILIVGFEGGFFTSFFIELDRQVHGQLVTDGRLSSSVRYSDWELVHIQVLDLVQIVIGRIEVDVGRVYIILQSGLAIQFGRDIGCGELVVDLARAWLEGPPGHVIFHVFPAHVVVLRVNLRWHFELCDFRASVFDIDVVGQRRARFVFKRGLDRDGVFLGEGRVIRLDKLELIGCLVVLHESTGRCVIGT